MALDQGNRLKKFIKEADLSLDQRRYVSEAIYTGTETGVINIDGLSVDDALRIHAVVQWAMNATGDDINTIRM